MTGELKDRIFLLISVLRNVQWTENQDDQRRQRCGTLISARILLKEHVVDLELLSMMIDLRRKRITVQCSCGGTRQQNHVP